MDNHNITDPNNNTQEILEPNYTQIPNVFFDYWMAELSGGEYKVLSCIARKTFGWHKTSDSISLSQIEKMAKMSRRGVINAIDKLESHGLILKKHNQSAEHGYEASTFVIRVFVPEKVSKNTGASEMNAPPPSELIAPGLVNSVHLQKKELLKESKKPPQPPLKKDLVSPKPVVVFPLLESIPGLPNNLAQKLTEDFTEEQLEHAVRVMESSDAHIPKPYGYLRDCIEQGWEPTRKQPEETEANKRVIRDCFAQMDGRKIGPFAVTVGLTYVEFNAGGNTKVQRFDADQKGFEILVREFAKKVRGSS